MRNAYYEGTLVNDVQTVNKIKSFDKRQKALTLGASLLGIASYGIMKTYGYDDLVSNYPMIAYYALVLLDSKLTYTKYLKAKARLDGLMDDLTDKKEELLSSLLGAATGKSEFVSKSYDFTTYTTFDDFFVGNVDNIALIRQESIVDISKEGKTENSSFVFTYTPEESETLYKTR